MTSVESEVFSQGRLVILEPRDDENASHAERLASVSSGEGPAGRLSRDYLLISRFALVNLVAAALLAAAYLQGWVDTVLDADASRLTVVIFGVFLIGLAISAWRAWQTSYELNEANSGQPSERSRAGQFLAAVYRRDAGSRANSAGALNLKLINRIAIVRHLASCLVVLGLVGTVLGFIIAFSGVDPRVAADVSAIGPMVSTLISGMSVALYTTLVGAVLNIWLTLNYHLLATGTAKLAALLVRLGEAHAQH